MVSPKSPAWANPLPTAGAVLANSVITSSRNGSWLNRRNPIALSLPGPRANS
jgi:hypothetical protein